MLHRMAACGHSVPLKRCAVCQNKEWAESQKTPNPTAEQLAKVKRIIQSA